MTITETPAPANRQLAPSTPAPRRGTTTAEPKDLPMPKPGAARRSDSPPAEPATPPKQHPPGEPDPGPAKPETSPKGLSPGRSTPAPDQAHGDTHTVFVGGGEVEPVPDQTRDGTHTAVAGGGFSLADPGLYLSAAQLDNVEQLRIAVENRHRQATRDVADTDGLVRGLGLPETDPAVIASTALLAALKAAEHQAELTLQRQLRRHPFSAWQKATHGVGEKQLARLLAVIGDPYVNANTGQPRTVSALWAYCGLHTLPAPDRPQAGAHDVGVGGGASAPVAGHPAVDAQEERAGHGRLTPDGGQGSADALTPNAAVRSADRHPNHVRPDAQGTAVRVAARRQRGQQGNWSTTAKTRAYLIAESCIKQAASPYRATYEIGRAKYADALHAAPCAPCGGEGKPAPAGTPLRLGHQHARAMRLVSKAILRDLWREARRLHLEGKS